MNETTTNTITPQAIKTCSTSQVVFCRPLPPQAVEAKAGLRLAPERVKLVALDVVFPNFPEREGGMVVQPGDKVLVRGDCRALPWASKTLLMPDLEGEVILVPLKEIVAFTSVVPAVKWTLTWPMPQPSPFQPAGQPFPGLPYIGDTPPYDGGITCGNAADTAGTADPK